MEFLLLLSISSNQQNSFHYLVVLINCLEYHELSKNHGKHITTLLHIVYSFA
jgi:hypothetical protein